MKRNQRYESNNTLPSLDYDASVECEGCHVRNENIRVLLKGILKLAQHQGLMGDIALNEFDGPCALQCLKDMEEDYATTTS
jgi:hypothetical protein